LSFSFTSDKKCFTVILGKSSKYLVYDKYKDNIDKVYAAFNVTKDKYKLSSQEFEAGGKYYLQPVENEPSDHSEMSLKDIHTATEDQWKNIMLISSHVVSFSNVVFVVYAEFWIEVCETRWQDQVNFRVVC